MSMDWADYYAKTAHKEPRRTLLLALDRFEFDDIALPEKDLARKAIDLGCGGGRDTVELLRRGWSVLAIDAEQAAIEYLSARQDLPHGDRLKTLCDRFETVSLPQAHLVVSSFALPLGAPDAFNILWEKINRALAPGGRFAGQFFGDRDSWNNAKPARQGMTFLSIGQARALLAPLDTELFEEEEADSTTPRGERKHWHIFHVVARKP